MAKENIQKVIDLISNDSQLQAELAAAEDAESYKRTALDIAARNNLPVTSEEFDEVAVAMEDEGGTLKPEELEKVSGGGSAMSAMTCSSYSGKACTTTSAAGGCKV